MSAIYTRRGDAGNIDLGEGQTVSKASLLPQILGSIDELNVMIGWVKVALSDQNTQEKLHQIQCSLFEIAADIMHQKENKGSSKKFDDYSLKISELENEIDEIVDIHGSLKHFLYPGKNELSVRWHMARVVCRHVERSLVKFSLQYKVPAVVLAYINRLSDWFFIKAYEAEKEVVVPA